MSQSQELQNSKVDQTTTKKPTLRGRTVTGSGQAVKDSDLVPLSQVRDLIQKYGGKLFPTSSTAQTQQGIPNNDNTTTVGDIPSVGEPNGVLFYDAVGQASTDETNFSYQGNGLLLLVDLLLSSLTPSRPVKSDASNNLVSGLIILTTDVSGILPVANGGSGSSSGGYVGFSSQTAYTSVTRPLNTVQHNTGTKPILVKCWATIALGGIIQGLTDSANPPTTVVDDATIPAVALYAVSVSFVALPGNFYEVTLTGGTWGGWVEWV